MRQLELFENEDGIIEYSFDWARAFPQLCDYSDKTEHPIPIQTEQLFF